MGEKKHKKEKRDKKEKRSQKDRGRSGKKRSRKHSKKDKKKHRSQSKHRRRHAEASLSDVTSSSSSDEATSQHSGSPPRASKRRRQAEPIGTPPDFEETRRRIVALLKLSPDVRGDLSVILGRVDDGLGMDVEGVEPEQLRESLRGVLEALGMTKATSGSQAGSYVPGVFLRNGKLCEKFSDLLQDKPSTPDGADTAIGPTMPPPATPSGPTSDWERAEAAVRGMVKDVPGLRAMLRGLATTLNKEEGMKVAAVEPASLRSHLLRLVDALGMPKAPDGSYSWHATQRSDDDAPSKLAALMQRVFDDHAARKSVEPTRPPQASIGPTLPPPGVIGPAGPPPGSVASSSSPSPSDVIGPAMPPPNRAEVMGPPPRPATARVAGAGAGAGDGAGAGAGAGAGDESSDDDVGPVVALDPRARAGAAVDSRKLRRIRRAARQQAKLKRRADRAKFARLRGELPPPNSESSEESEGSEAEEAAAPKRPQRGEWMTQAPTDRHGLSALLRGGPESAVAQHRSFSRNGVVTEIDSSEWTDTPQQRAKRAAERAKKAVEEREARRQKAMRREAARREGREFTEDEKPMSKWELKDLEAKRFNDEYNKVHRPESLMAVHAKRIKKAEKKKKKKEKSADTSTKPGGFVYRPWNRETDLIGRKPADSSKLVNQAAMLNTRFSSSSRGRFL